MANNFIENDIKDLLDTFTWTVPVEGITKDTYIFVESHKASLNLKKPAISPDTNTVQVIQRSIRQWSGGTFGSDIFSFQGEIKLYAKTIPNMKLQLNQLKIIGDTVPNLTLLAPGISSPLFGTSIYWNNLIYIWAKNIPQ